MFQIHGYGMIITSTLDMSHVEEFLLFVIVNLQKYFIPNQIIGEEWYSKRIRFIIACHYISTATTFRNYVVSRECELAKEYDKNNKQELSSRSLVFNKVHFLF
jgi:hypothetical protein